MKKFKENNILIDKPKLEKPKIVHIPENISSVTESMLEAPLTLTPRRSQHLIISETSFRRILHKDLSMTPYKVQLAQKMPILEKNIYFQMKLILVLSHLGHRKPARIF